VINIDLVIGFPHSQNQYDLVLVIMGNLTKSAHFLPVRTNFSNEDHARLYCPKIVKLHGVPISIIFDHGTQFTSHFWRLFYNVLGTKVIHNTTFHPWSDRQAERIFQTLKEMLCSCMMIMVVVGSSTYLLWCL